MKCDSIPYYISVSHRCQGGGRCLHQTVKLPHCVFPVIQHVPTTAAPANVSWGNDTEVVLNATEVAAAPGYADPDGE